MRKRGWIVIRDDYTGYGGAKYTQVSKEMPKAKARLVANYLNAHTAQKHLIAKA